jgi:hypothetical protein
MLEVPSQAVLLVPPCFWKFFIFPQNLLIGVIEAYRPGDFDG